MYKKTINAVVFSALALLIFNCGDFHSCNFDGDHGPICDNCPCLICSSGLNSPAISGYDWDVTYCRLGNIKPVNPYFKFGEIAVDIDQPPRF